MNEPYTAEWHDGVWWVSRDHNEIIADDLEEDEARELAETLNEAVYADYGD
jgi:hypothetical protein